ncbi:MAG: 2-oxo acid dehydrogenase subunit E2 [Propionibacteriaceae bacterium]|jgi:2-oxoglutarate dehydrogenase E2 component (dihydrolipoamide succinyltransferase)|nr:2-oxo acid dehydrogenase subunit E2 [Propionibacteriaceae bacterium]
MATEVRLPALGESVTEGTLTQWLKAVGDPVRMDEPLLEISTDKVDTEVPSPVAGVLLARYVTEGATVPVGTVLGLIGEDIAATTPAPTVPKYTPAVAPEQPEQGVTPAAVVAPAVVTPASTTPESDAGAATEHQYVVPLVRKLAADLGVDLTTVTGTGVGGRIRKEDVQAAYQVKSANTHTAMTNAYADPATDRRRGTTERLSPVQAAVARHLTESLHMSAQLTAAIEVDLTQFAPEQRFAAVIAAAAAALARHAPLNATVNATDGTVSYASHTNIGVQLDTPYGLVTPVLRDTEQLGVAQVAAAVAQAKQLALTGAATPDMLAGGTFTITDAGGSGALSDTPVINQPQTAIASLGAVTRRPAVVRDASGNEQVAPRDMALLLLTYDRRVVDASTAGSFLGEVKATVEETGFAQR